MTAKPLAIVLLSGGLDSATTLALAKSQGVDVCALSIRYGQRHGREIEAAREVGRAGGVRRHVVVDIDLSEIAPSALTADIEVPKNRPLDKVGDGIPVTYVPARNTIFLSLALAWAEVLGAGSIFIGVNAVDYSGYPDCRAEYIAAYEKMAALATKSGVEGAGAVKIVTPLIDLSKGQIIQTGLRLGVDYSLTRTCYDPDDGGLSCGACDACLLRLAGFAECGAVDPIPYQDGEASA